MEIRKKADLDAFSRIALFQRILPSDEYYLIIASRIISRKLLDLAERLSIRFVQIPSGVKLGDLKVKKQPKGKITSIKSWRVFTRVLLEEITSIRNISIKESISYAWTHRSVNTMLNLEIFEKEGDLIKIGNVEKALDLTAMERPMQELKMNEVSIPDDLDPMDISLNLNSLGIEHAFTCYTSGTLYSGYGTRHDSFQLYIKEKIDIGSFERLFKGEGEVRKMVLYRPDRNVFEDIRKLDGLDCVSLDQTIMDLAGLGFSGRDMTLHMVRNYANIRLDQ
ncbi:MAG: hypothetical protein U9R75_00610 [Candidatus Thermoplasmatota archaeon]|nr:hypothetical protein [Candidatus Thermoplasmatota archaeon]